MILSLSVFGATTTTYVHDVDYGDENLLLLESGEVLKFPAGNKFNIPSPKSLIKVSWDKTRLITELSILGKMHPVKPRENFEEQYEPTTIKNGTAKDYFGMSRVSHGETQCYNRAHIWTFELWKKYQVKSQKIFLFFTRKYIREHDFGWWFHVAPLLRTKTWTGNVDDKVMDPRYITAPRDIKWWTDKFITTSEECKEIQLYSEYADYPYVRDCFVLKAPMYIYQPLDLEMQEVWGIQKNSFQALDVKWAYKEAFNMDYEGLEK
jgi:hypothetical protein